MSWHRHDRKNRLRITVRRTKKNRAVSPVSQARLEHLFSYIVHVTTTIIHDGRMTKSMVQKSENTQPVTYLIRTDSRSASMHSLTQGSVSDTAR